jgi:hypothetical protein
MFISYEHGNKMNEREKKIELAERDLEILETATEAFRRETKLNVEKGRLDVRIAGKYVEATVRIEAPIRTIEYLVEIKPTITETTLGKLAHQFQDTPGKWLVVTRYVPTYLAKKMKELNIQFIDTAGNAYLNEKPLLIFINGNRAPTGFKEETEEGIWGRGGIKVVFALFCDERTINGTYREIAETAKVALGTVGGIFKDLAQQGYLLDLGIHGRRLQRKKELFDTWAEAYAQKLRPKTLIGRYITDRDDLWQQRDLLPYHACWGGEVAANKLTNYLKPEIVTIYARKPVNDLVLNLRLRKKEQGNVEIREQFWRFDPKEPERDMVHPILVYADLTATADARNIEAAKMIYEEHIERHLREN